MKLIFVRLVLPSIHGTVDKVDGYDPRSISVLSSPIGTCCESQVFDVSWDTFARLLRPNVDSGTHPRQQMVVSGSVWTKNVAVGVAIEEPRGFKGSPGTYQISARL